MHHVRACLDISIEGMYATAKPYLLVNRGIYIYWDYPECRARQRQRLPPGRPDGGFDLISIMILNKGSIVKCQTVKTNRQISVETATPDQAVQVVKHMLENNRKLSSMNLKDIQEHQELYAHMCGKKIVEFVGIDLWFIEPKQPR